jgi:hypothetical protein
MALFMRFVTVLPCQILAGVVWSFRPLPERNVVTKSSNSVSEGNEAEPAEAFGLLPPYLDKRRRRLAPGAAARG